jgi:hypothetical protein
MPITKVYIGAKVPVQLAETVRLTAEKNGMSVSEYLTRVLEIVVLNRVEVARAAES